MPNPRRLYKLTELREAKHLTLEQMARYCGLSGKKSRESVGKWEQGLSIPEPRRRIKFIDYLCNGLGLWNDKKGLYSVWEILEEEWGWKPLTDKELKAYLPEISVQPEERIFADSKSASETHPYIHMLVVLPAPVANQSGKGPPSDRVHNFWSEWRGLRQAIERTRQVLVGAKTPWTVVRLVPPTAEELCDALALHQPGYQVVHISCHSSRDGLILEDALGRERLLPNIQLANALAGTTVKLVVLNAGAMFELGQMLVNYVGIPCVIATQQPLDDSETRVLTEKLYHRLAVGATVGEALEEVRRHIVGQIKTGDLPTGSDPQLHVDKLVLIGNERVRLAADNLTVAESLFILDPTPHSELPFELLTGFVGRKTELLTLANWFAQDNSHIFALTGVGGLGKTSLALNAALRNGYRFSALILARANETPDFGPWDVLQKINKVLHLASTPDEATDPGSALVQRLNTRAILLILDNLESLSTERTHELAQVLKSLDPRSPSRVLMTLRPHEQGELTKLVKANRIDLSALDRIDALRLTWEEAARWQINLITQGYNKPLPLESRELEELARDAKLTNLMIEEVALLNELALLAFHHPKLIQLAVATLSEYGWASTHLRLERLRGEEIEQALEDYIGQVLDDLIQKAPACLDILHAILVFAGGVEASRLYTVVLGTEIAEANTEVIDFEEQRLNPIVKTNLLRHDNQRYALDPPVRGYLEGKRPPDTAMQALYHHRHAQAYLPVVIDYNVAIQTERMNYTAPLEWNNVTVAFRWLSRAAPNDNRAARLLLAYVHYGRTVFVYNYDPRLLRWLEAAQEVAKQLGDQQAQAEILVTIGQVQFYHDEHEQALACYQAVLSLCQLTGDRQCKADALRGIAEVQRILHDDNDAALANYNAALALYSTLDDRIGEAITYWGIGRVQEVMDQYEAALTNFNAALIISREINDRAGEADALAGIGEIQLARKELPAAMENCSAALTLYRAVGDRFGEAETISSIGDVLCLWGEYDEALISYHTSIKLHREIGLEGVLGYLGIGNVQQLRGEYDAAIESYTKALVICREEEDLLYEAETLWSIGEIQRLKGDYDAASASYQAAFQLYRAVNSPLGEANTLASQGQVAGIHNKQNEVDRLFTQAIDICRAIDNRYSIAEKLGQYGWVLLSLGHEERARSCLQQAASLFAGLGFDDEANRHRQVANL